MKSVMLILLISASVFSYGGDAWYTKPSIDEMTGKKSWYAYSPKASPIRALDYPYGKVYSQAIVGCSNGSYWSYLFFSEAPNLTVDEDGDGYSVSKNRIKWDQELDILKFKQNWGEKYLHIQKNSKFIRSLREHNELYVELNWYNNPGTIFKYSLEGSSVAIKELEKTCGTVPIYISPQELENKKLDQEIPELPSTKFVANHTKEAGEIIGDITKVMGDWGFTLQAITESTMKWSHPGRPTEKPGKLLNCGWTFGFPTWANTGVYADGAIYTYFTDSQVFINWIVKARHRSASDFVKDCRSTGRVENSILSAVAGKKVKIKP